MQEEGTNKANGKNAEKESTIGSHTGVILNRKKNKSTFVYLSFLSFTFWKTSLGGTNEEHHMCSHPQPYRLFPVSI